MIEHSLLVSSLREEYEIMDDDIEDIIQFLEDLGIHVIGKPKNKNA